VAICGRRREPLDETAKQLRELGASVHVGSCDIRDYGQVKAFVDQVQKQLGDITILINNAGGYATHSTRVWRTFTVLLTARVQLNHRRQFPMAAEAITPNGYVALKRHPAECSRARLLASSYTHNAHMFALCVVSLCSFAAVIRNNLIGTWYGTLAHVPSRYDTHRVGRCPPTGT
jgi:NAD(P)-dependent dehydrogenase (short-subunit alcohol dehydrogenase family)